jgi:hypothetical protein
VKAIDIQKLLGDALKARGTEQVVNALESLLKPSGVEAPVLTIIANAGIHEIPEVYLRGDIYEASRGDWNVVSEEALLFELTKILSRLAKKLRSKAWKQIYLIPTGHPILSLQIKAMVYRILRLNTVDLYHKAGTYFEVNLDQRAIALGRTKRA